MFKYSELDIKVLSDSRHFNQESLEKVLRLADILDIFNTDSVLKAKYVLKGGTAINLCIFDFPRLSVDIDLDFNMECSKDSMQDLRKKHGMRIRALMELEGYSIDRKSKFTHALDSYVLKYTNMNQRPDNLKLEINYINRVHILKPTYSQVISNIVEINHVLTLHKVELYASKLSALIGRTTVRDLYDAHMMITCNIMSQTDMNLLRKCTVFYLMTSNAGLSVEDLILKFVQNTEYLTNHTLKKRLVPLLKKGSVMDIEKMKNSVNTFIHELLALTENESEYVTEFLIGNHVPSLLFDEEPISARLMNHPMAIWKMRHTKEKNTIQNN